MSAKVVRAIITQSKMKPHLASIRAVDGGDLRLALAEAGFQVGDEVAITPAAPDRRIPHSLLCDLDFIEYQDYAMNRGHGCVRDEGLRGCECEKAFAKAAK